MSYRAMKIPGSLPGPAFGSPHTKPPPRRGPTLQEEQAAEAEAAVAAKADAYAAEFRDHIADGTMQVEDVVAIARQREVEATTPTVSPADINRLEQINAEIAALKHGPWSARSREVNAAIGALRVERAKILDAAEASGAIKVQILAERTDYNLREGEWTTKSLRNKPIRR